MMISPQGFVEEQLKGKSSNEIERVIDSFKKRIRELKRKLENPCESDVFVCPHPKTQISMCFDYIKAAREYLYDQTGELYMSKADERAVAFSNQLENIEMIELDISSFGSISFPQIVRFLDDEVLIYEKPYSEVLEDDIQLYKKIKKSGIEEFKIDFLKSAIFKLLDYDKQGFLQDFDRLNIGAWRNHYNTRRFGYEVLDGTQWCLTITYLDGKKKEYSGSNSYPYNFDELCDLFEIKMEDEDEEFD